MAPRADAVRNTGRLVEAARELFDAEGNGVPLDRIAQHAGVGNATLYRNFPSRGDLLAAVYADDISALVARGSSLLTAAKPVDALFTWLRELARLVADKPDLARTPDAAWTAELESAATALIAKARKGGLGAARAGDLVAAVYGIATTADEEQTKRLLKVLRTGLTG